MSKNSHTKKGFTLVEMIVALMIFSIVAVVALSALVKIVSANKKAQTLQSAITNLNFALESMSREIRVGSNYYCQSGTGKTFDGPEDLYGSSKNCGSNDTSGTLIAFVSSKPSPDGLCNLIFAYRFTYDDSGEDRWFLEKGEQTYCEDEISITSDYAPIISNAVVINGYRVSVFRPQPGQFPLGFIQVSGYAGDREQDRTYFDVQTAVSARVTSE